MTFVPKLPLSMTLPKQEYSAERAARAERVGGNAEDSPLTPTSPASSPVG